MRHDHGTATGMVSRGSVQAAEHARAELRVGLATWPGETVVNLRFVAVPQVSKVALQLLERHPFDVAAVNLPRPLRGCHFKSPGATELARDFAGAFERAGEECDGDLCVWRASKQSLKFRSAGRGQWKIK